MRRRSLSLLFVLALGTSAFGGEPLRDQPLRDRRDGRGSFNRIVRIIKKVFTVSSNSDGLIPPRPSDPPKP
jgi:hypothetical protein